MGNENTLKHWMWCHTTVISALWGEARESEVQYQPGYIVSMKSDHCIGDCFKEKKEVWIDRDDNWKAEALNTGDSHIILKGVNIVQNSLLTVIASELQPSEAELYFPAHILRQANVYQPVLKFMVDLTPLSVL